MTSAVLSPAGVALLLAHLLLLGAALFVQGLSLQQRVRARRLASGPAALALGAAAFTLASGWLERGALVISALWLAPVLLGLVIIRENQVGIVIKKFARRSLPAGEFIALNGGAGYQADTLPPGVHFGFCFWQFRVIKTPVVVVAPREIALVVAAAGVRIAELQAQSTIKRATGEAESTGLRALGESEAIRATGTAKAGAYRAGVESLGAANYTVMQLTQTLAEKNVRIVPDVSVTGAQGHHGLLDSMLALAARDKIEKRAA